MALALFDLDNTLIGGDSDYLWGEFAVESGFVDAQYYAEQNAAFYRDYQAGGLDIFAYLEFALAPLTQFSEAELAQHHQAFFETKIAPIWLPKAVELVEKHRAKGDTLVIITATNRFITEPIADKLGVAHLIASEGEIVNGRYTGEVKGVPCFREGKIERLKQWQQAQDRNWSESYFYSDSFNDIPLLEQVDHPIAVDPDPTLLNHAKDHAIPIISLR